MEEHLPVLWDCFVNSNCKRNPNDPESMRQRDFVELILNDVKFLKPPIRADLEILHKGEASNHPEGKFKFSCFVDAVIKIVTKKKSAKYSELEMVALVISKYFVPLSQKRYVREGMAEILEEASVKELEKRFMPSLKNSFQFFAKMPSNYETETLKRHTKRKDINQMTQSLNFHDYQNLCACFNMSSGVGSALTALTNSTLAKAFMDSCNIKYKDAVGGLTVEELWEVLVRCSLLNFEKNKAAAKQGGSKDTTKKDGDDKVVSVERKIVLFFTHISNNLEDSVSRLLEIGNTTEKSGGMKGLSSGHRDASSGGAMLQAGTHEFSKIVWDILRLEEKITVDPVPVVEHSADQTLWLIFLHCNIQNNAKDWQNMKKRELVMLVRHTELHVMEAEVNVIHQFESGKKHSKRFEFDDFKTALEAIAVKAYRKQKDLSKNDAFHKMITDHFLNDQKLLHIKSSCTKDMLDCKDLQEVFTPALKNIFRFFAGQPTEFELETLGRHPLRHDINHQNSSFHYEKFLDFAAAGNLSSGTGSSITALSLQQLSTAFVDSIEVYAVNDVGGLTFEEFLECLVRIAIAFQFPAARDSCHSLELLFCHMSHSFEESVHKIVNGGNERTHHSSGPTAGARSNSGNHGTLIKGIKDFNANLFSYGHKSNGAVGGAERGGGAGAGVAAAESIFSFAEKKEGEGGLSDFASSMREGL